MINPLLYAFAGKKFRTQLGEIVDRLILGKNKKREFSNITQITMAAAGNNPLRRNSALWGTLDLTKQWFQIIYSERRGTPIFSQNVARSS